MTIRELYKVLESYGIKYGWNLPVVASNDCEGNNYSTFNKDVVVSIIHQGEDEWLEKAKSSEISWGDIDKHRCCGICLYPWEDNYLTAEKACKGGKNEI